MLNHPRFNADKLKHGVLLTKFDHTHLLFAYFQDGHQIHKIRNKSEIINCLTIVSARKHFSNTNLSDLSIVGTCDIFVYRMRYHIM